VKRRDLESILHKLNYRIVSQNGHVKWSNGVKSVFVPHHKELNGLTVHKILKLVPEYRKGM
jgi:hypothetical protein